MRVGSSCCPCILALPGQGRHGDCSAVAGWTTGGSSPPGADPGTLHREGQCGGNPGNEPEPGHPLPTCFPWQAPSSIMVGWRGGPQQHRSSQWLLKKTASMRQGVWRGGELHGAPHWACQLSLASLGMVRPLGLAWRGSAKPLRRGRPLPPSPSPSKGRGFSGMEG